MPSILDSLARGAIIPFLPVLKQDVEGRVEPARLRNLRLTELVFECEKGQRVMVSPAEVVASTHAMDSKAFAVAEAVVETPGAVLQAVSIETGVPVAVIKGTGRRKKTAHARLIAYRLLRDRTEMSLSEIGEVLGGRDHTTVLSGIKRTKGRTGYDETISRVVALLDERLEEARHAAKALLEAGRDGGGGGGGDEAPHEGGGVPEEPEEPRPRVRVPQGQWAAAFLSAVHGDPPERLPGEAGDPVPADGA